MYYEAKEVKTHKHVLLTALIALAILISLATAGKASATDSDIESIKYEPAKQEVVCDTEGEKFYYYSIETGRSKLNPMCLVKHFGSLDDFNMDTLADPELFADDFIASGDKLIITRKDGSIQTLTPGYMSILVAGGGSSGDPGTYEYCLVWVDEDNNKVTDVVTDFSWSKEPKPYTDSRFLVKEYKPGIYDNTVTVKVGDKSTTFKKKITITGSLVSSYDKKVPVISNKKIKSGYKKLYKDTIIDGFRMKWPKYKGADSYSVKLKAIYPKSLKSSKYKTENGMYHTEKNIIDDETNFIMWPDRWSDDINYSSYEVLSFTEEDFLTSDTMMEISVSVIKKSNPEKTGSRYVYGKYSKPVRLFLSKNKTLKAKGKKRSVKLTWNKVYRASGYKIKYSTKKNMSKAKTIKVKGGKKKAYTIKKLKKNKKYYFQITPYKVYKGKTYTGYASAKKAAKAK